MHNPQLPHLVPVIILQQRSIRPLCVQGSIVHRGCYQQYLGTGHVQFCIATLSASLGTEMHCNVLVCAILNWPQCLGTVKCNINTLQMAGKSVSRFESCRAGWSMHPIVSLAAAGLLSICFVYSNCSTIIGHICIICCLLHPCKLGHISTYVPQQTVQAG